MRTEAENNASAANILNGFISRGEVDCDDAGNVTVSKKKPGVLGEGVGLEQPDLSSFSFPPVDDEL